MMRSLTQTEYCPYLVVLIGCDSDEVSLGKDVGPEGTVWKFQNVVGSHDMKPGLVFVHGVQNRLKRERKK